MSRQHPPRDHDSAPGDEPGAESFAKAVPSEPPQGVVRLSDLFSAADFDDDLSPARTRRGAASRPVSTPAIDVLAPGARRARRPDRDAPARGTGTPADPPACGDAPAQPPAPVDASDVPYESLFGDAGDTRRRPRRERTPATALQRALGLLTRREHSRKELTQKLVSRGVDPTEVAAAVDKLSGAGWQDERRFAENLVRSRAAAGYGPLHIRAELGTHALPEGVRESALEAFEGDWAEIAREVVARRFARIEDARQRERKAADHLIRRGFPGDVVRAASKFDPED